MNYKEFIGLVNELQEKNGELYDANGNLRAVFNANKHSLELVPRYFANVKYIRFCGNGESRTKIYCEAYDREKKIILGKFDNEKECLIFLRKNYPNFEDPLSYWS